MTLNPGYIIEQCRYSAQKLFPEDETNRNGYYSDLLASKLREVCKLYNDAR